MTRPGFLIRPGPLTAPGTPYFYLEARSGKVLTSGRWGRSGLFSSPRPQVGDRLYSPAGNHFHLSPRPLPLSLPNTLVSELGFGSYSSLAFQLCLPCFS